MKTSTLGRIDKIELRLDRIDRKWKMKLTIGCESVNRKSIPISRRQWESEDMESLIAKAVDHISEMNVYIQNVYGERKIENEDQMDSTTEGESAQGSEIAGVEN